MKQFKSLSEAFDYRMRCPLCDGKMEDDPSNWGVITKRSWITGRDGITHTLTFQIRNTTIEVDYNTGHILTMETKEMLQDYVGGVTIPAYGTSLSYPKLEMIGTRMECPECRSYDYTIQIHLSLPQQKITNILLNSETITITNDGGDHEIRNNYALEQTEYWHYTNRKKLRDMFPKFDNVLTLPLIPLDLQRPDQTLQRIRTLTTFS